MPKIGVDTLDTMIIHMMFMILLLLLPVSCVHACFLFVDHFLLNSLLSGMRCNDILLFVFVITVVP